MRRQAGFSLIEIMCAILILGVALVGLTQGITTALSSSKESEIQTSASLIAAGQIEILRAEEYLVNGVTEDDCGDELPLYRWRQTVSNTDMDGLHEIEVVVENANSGKIICDLRTLLFDPLYREQDEAKETKPLKKSRKEGAKL
ncbi:MAG: prepilin-type N-terminal cleavage/methylation domain-containing protein [Verrucomicrobiota bacterium]